MVAPLGWKPAPDSSADDRERAPWNEPSGVALRARASLLSQCPLPASFSENDFTAPPDGGIRPRFATCSCSDAFAGVFSVFSRCAHGLPPRPRKLRLDGGICAIKARSQPCP